MTTRPGQTKQPRAPRVFGFTLIELMIAVAVVSLLAAFALPQYRAQIKKSRRTDAKTGLLDLASREERFMTVNNKYTNVAGNLGYSAFPVQVPNPSAYSYQLSVTLSTDTLHYTATAAPNSAIGQSTDGCGSYTLTELGVQGNTNLSNGMTTASCW